MKKIEVVWRQVRFRKFKSPEQAKAFLKLKAMQDAEEVEVFEVIGDTTTAYYDFGSDHTKPKKMRRVEMDG